MDTIVQVSPVGFRTMYPSDLTNAEWQVLAPLFPDPVYDEPKNGRPREWSFRTILDATFYVTKTGCQWRCMPSDFPPWSTVYDYFRNWRNDGFWGQLNDELRRAVRVKEGKKPEPTAACIDSQSVKSTLAGKDSTGYDGGKKINGRKRHIAVDTLGLILVVWVHALSVTALEANWFLHLLLRPAKGLRRSGPIAATEGSWRSGSTDPAPEGSWKSPNVQQGSL